MQGDRIEKLFFLIGLIDKVTAPSKKAGKSILDLQSKAKIASDGQPYPEDYRKMCSAGARFYHVPDKFTKRKSSK